MEIGLIFNLRITINLNKRYHIIVILLIVKLLNYHFVNNDTYNMNNKSKFNKDEHVHRFAVRERTKERNKKHGMT